MSKFFSALGVNALYSVIVAVIIILVVAGALFGVKYFRTHLPATKLQALIQKFCESIVNELDTTDASGQTKLHSAIKQVLEALAICHVHIPDGIETIIEAEVEKAVTNMKYKKAITNNNNASAANTTPGTVAPTAPATPADSSNLPADDNDMVTTGTAPSVETGTSEDDDGKVNVPKAEDEVNSTPDTAAKA